MPGKGSKKITTSRRKNTVRRPKADSFDRLEKAVKVIVSSYYRNRDQINRDESNLRKRFLKEGLERLRAMRWYLALARPKQVVAEKAFTQGYLDYDCALKDLKDRFFTTVMTKRRKGGE